MFCFQNHDVRIIIADGYEADARRIICAVSGGKRRPADLLRQRILYIFCISGIFSVQAHRVGIRGRRYVWLMVGYYSKDWLTNYDNVPCTNQELLDVVDGYLGFDSIIRTPYLNTPLVSGKTISDWDRDMEEFIKGLPAGSVTLNNRQYASFGYDSFWALALALNRSVEFLRLTNNNKTLDTFKYDDVEIPQIIYNSFFNLTFNGTTGEVIIDQNGENSGNVRIDQYMGNGTRPVAYHNYATGKLTFLRELRFRGSSVIPRDNIIIETKFVDVNISAQVIFCTLAVFGICLAIGCLIFNYKYKEKRIVKLSSPHINNIICVGCILCYITVIVFAFRATTILCQMTAWFLCIGFTLSFGGLFSKTWRVSRIFNNSKAIKIKGEMTSAGGSGPSTAGSGADDAYLESIVSQYDTYEQYLDAQILPEDRYYLQDEDIARRLVELGHRGSGDVVKREDFDRIKRTGRDIGAVVERRAVDGVVHRLYDNLDDPFLQALANREEDNRVGNMASIIFIRDTNAKGQEVSSYIDYAHRLWTEDFHKYFVGKKKIISKPSDLSYFNWDTQNSKWNDSPNYQVVIDERSGLLFKNIRDRKIVCVDPDTDNPGDNTMRIEVSSPNYIQIVLYDHVIRKLGI